MFNLKYNKQGKLVQELKDTQERECSLKKEIAKNKCFPRCSYEIKKNPYSNTETTELLSNAIAQLWLGKVDYEKFNILLKRIYDFDNAIEYFETLGKYFINLSGNIEEIQRLNKELRELEYKEVEIKNKLGIK